MNEQKRPVPTVLLSHTEHKKIVLFPCACVYVRFVTCSKCSNRNISTYTHTHTRHTKLYNKNHIKMCVMKFRDRFVRVSNKLNVNVN